MIKFCTLASSSSGNCVYVQCDQDALLIDCGLSARMTLSLLEQNRLEANAIRGICVTHEHSDHIKGIKVLQKKLNVPVMASQGTINALQDQLFETPQHMLIPVDTSFFIGNMEVQPFRLSHDAAEPFGYRVFTRYGSVAVCTDTGIFSKDILNELSGCDCVLLESNHDLNMLQDNPAYPAALKKRIAGRCGHLNNRQSAEAAALLYQEGTRHFLLGHLSPHNNTPAAAYDAVKAGLEEAGAVIGEDVGLYVAPQGNASPVLIRR